MAIRYRPEPGAKLELVHTLNGFGPGAGRDARAAAGSVRQMPALPPDRDGASVFRLCERSRTDPRYPRYPALAVVRCGGFESVVAEPAGFG
jgi:hypothetical protein